MLEKQDSERGMKVPTYKHLYVGYSISEQYLDFHGGLCAREDLHLSILPVGYSHTTLGLHVEMLLCPHKHLTLDDMVARPEPSRQVSVRQCSLGMTEERSCSYGLLQQRAAPLTHRRNKTLWTSNISLLK